MEGQSKKQVYQCCVFDMHCKKLTVPIEQSNLSFNGLARRKGLQ